MPLGQDHGENVSCCGSGADLSSKLGALIYVGAIWESFCSRRRDAFRFSTLSVEDLLTFLDRDEIPVEILADVAFVLSRSGL